jgi:hypothetical protein
MPDQGKRWIQVAADAAEAEVSQKKVVSSNYVDVRGRSLDDAATGRTRVHYELGGMWRDVLSYEGTDFDTLLVPEAGQMQVVGAPEIPQEGLYVAVPENAEVTDVRVVEKTERDLPGEYDLLPASEPVLEGMEAEHVPDPAVYDSDEPFPGKDVELLGTKHIAGRKVAHVMVYLLQYRPRSKRIKVLESIDIEVLYETLPGMDAGPQRKLLRKSPIAQMILDSDSAEEGERSVVDSLSRDAPGIMALSEPGLRDTAHLGEFLIVTTDELEFAVEPLATAKSRDHSTMVVTKEEIVAQFPAPSAEESIKAFLGYAVNHWRDPPDWVVLAGDVEQIPTCIMDFETVHPQLPPKLASDHFYADLWDDLAPELVVSRLPTSDPSVMHRLCELAASGGSQSGAWKKNLLLAAYQSSGYINCSEDIARAAGAHFAVSKRYGGQSSSQDVKDVLNDGVVIANYRGHGDVDAWAASNGLDIADVQALNNADRIPLVFSIACWNAQIDLPGECFGETWIRSEKALTFLGATRPSFTKANHDFNRYLFDAILHYDLIQVGDIVRWATAKLLLNFSPAKYARDNVRMYVLLGDPTAGVFFVGNRNSKRLHHADCRWVDRMSEASKAFYSSIQEAGQSAYQPCYYCLPQ